VPTLQHGERHVAHEPTVQAMDPRIVRTRSAVLRAATDLMVEGGPAAMTVDAVVARSGVAKSTIYRHWPSRDDLFIAVIESHAPRLADPAPGTDVVDALRDAVHSVAASLADPDWARLLPALLSLRHHVDDVKALEERLEDRRDEVLSSLIERAAAEGVIEAGVDVPEAINQLLGPLVLAQLAESIPLDAGLADRTLDRFLAAYRPAGPANGR
jgi:AcrR family transcriptional regulator